MPSDKRARQRAGRAARVAELQRAQQRRRRRTRTVPFIVALVAVAVIAIVITGVSGGGKSKSSPTTVGPTSSLATPTTVAGPPTAAPVKAGTITGATPCPKFDGSSPHIITFSQPPPKCITAGHTYTENIQTNVGNVTVQFDTTKTPDTANNFIVLSLYHYFDGTSMFRTDQSIGIIQGGSPHTQTNADPGPGYTIPDEGKGFTYAPGDLVMARTQAPNSAGSQYFFCVTSACANLNGQGTYVVFAKVTAGLPVLQSILSSNESSAGSSLGGAPSKLILIERTTVTQS